LINNGLTQIPGDAPPFIGIMSECVSNTGDKDTSVKGLTHPLMRYKQCYLKTRLLISGKGLSTLWTMPPPPYMGGFFVWT
jgi:hypothetical protein